MAIGSFVNHLLGGANQKTPEVGMGATMLRWSDRAPATVVEVLHFKSGAKKGQVRGVVVTEDDYEVTSGSIWDGSAKYEFTSNPESPRRATYLINQHGQFVLKGSTEKLAMGYRDCYRDPSH
jgi:hypothetical protein